MIEKSWQSWPTTAHPRRTASRGQARTLMGQKNQGTTSKEVDFGVPKTMVRSWEQLERCRTQQLDTAKEYWDRCTSGDCQGASGWETHPFCSLKWHNKNKCWQKKDVTTWQKKGGCGREETSGNQSVCRRLAGQLCWQHLHKYFF